MSNRRKIIEIYATEKEDDTVSFDIKKVEKSNLANSTMKMLVYMFSMYKSQADEMIIEEEE